MQPLRLFHEKIVKKKVTAVFLYLLYFSVIVIMTATQKTGLWELDEVFSYGLSNYAGEGIVMPVSDGHTYIPSSQIFRAYMAVDEQNAFRYDNVWQNQADDVHPPLYYAVLHTICSLFPGCYSKWPAASVNILFALGVLFFIRKLVLLWTGDEFFSFYASLAFIFSAGILSMTSFFRMYIMAMFWVAAFTYALVSQMECASFSRKGFLSVMLFSACGALTHYYCILYIVIFSFFCGLYLLLQKRMKDFGLFCLAQACAAGTAVLIFPSMLTHIFSGYRGKQSFENMASQTLVQNLSAIRRAVLMIDRTVFGGVFFCIVVLGACVLITLRSGRRSISSVLMPHMASFICCLGSCALYFLAVSRIAVSEDMKYYSPIYGVLFCTAVSIFGLWCKGVWKTGRGYLVFLLALFIMTVNGWREEKWPYLYRSSQELLEETSAYRDTDCICVYSDPLEIYTLYHQIFHFRSATFYRQEDLDNLCLSELSADNDLIVLTENVLDDRENVDMLERIRNLCPHTDSCDFLGDAGYFHLYHLSSAEGPQGDEGLDGARK